MSDDFRKMGFRTSQPKADSGTAKKPRVPTHPEMWDEITAEYRGTSEGSEPGRWSVRKAVLSQREYARRGGDFVEVEEE